MLRKGNGRRIFRARLPRWVVAVTLAAVAVGMCLVATSIGTIYGDYVSLRKQRATLAAMLPRLTDQQATIEAYREQARALRAEIDSWRQIHARILEPFGPDAGLGGRGHGIGGGTSTSPLDGDADQLNVKEEMTRLAVIVQEEGDYLRALEQFLSRAAKVLASLPSRWPIHGPINSEFGRRFSPWTSDAEHHSGIDIGAPIGTAVLAPAPGTVLFSGWQAEYGNTVIIDHGNDTKSLYGHLSRLVVTTDQQVRRGDTIALTGNTGRSSGPHLHYEIQVAGQAVNPNTYLWE